MQPHFLPDGRHYLFLAGPAQAAVLSVGARDSAEAARRRLAGAPFPIAEQVTSSFFANFSAAGTRVLAYLGGAGGGNELRWCDREGKTAPAGPPQGYGDVRFSPDGKRVALSIGDSSGGMTGRDIWLLEWGRNVRTKFTFDPGIETSPVWSPDGSRIAFASGREGGLNLYVKAASGSGREELLLKTEDSKFPADWSLDGRYLVYTAASRKTRQDIWMLPGPGVPGDRKPQVYLQTEFDESHARISPDGKYLAYNSNESGRAEVYVRPFPDATAGKWQVSSGGGGQPQWSRDGRELYYLGANRRLMAAPVKTAAAFEVATPTPLFETSIPGNIAPTATHSTRYGVAPDGRFLVVSSSEGTDQPMTIVLNWAPRGR